MNGPKVICFVFIHKFDKREIHLLLNEYKADNFRPIHTSIQTTKMFDVTSHYIHYICVATSLFGQISLLRIWLLKEFSTIHLLCHNFSVKLDGCCCTMKENTVCVFNTGLYSEQVQQKSHWSQCSLASTCWY